jgi:hypothetical protein
MFVSGMLANNLFAALMEPMEVNINKFEELRLLVSGSAPKTPTHAQTEFMQVSLLLPPIIGG